MASMGLPDWIPYTWATLRWPFRTSLPWQQKSASFEPGRGTKGLPLPSLSPNCVMQLPCTCMLTAGHKTYTFSILCIDSPHPSMRPWQAKKVGGPWALFRIFPRYPLVIFAVKVRNVFCHTQVVYTVYCILSSRISPQKCQQNTQKCLQILELSIFSGQPNEVTSSLALGRCWILLGEIGDEGRSWSSQVVLGAIQMHLVLNWKKTAAKTNTTHKHQRSYLVKK